ncbi:hypothetical protein LIA77_09872 [Sarocladium implicatum]|nr:hypothetical protein LIA77_09872 [Sarocladium implicatum]
MPLGIRDSLPLTSDMTIELRRLDQGHLSGLYHGTCLASRQPHPPGTNQRLGQVTMNALFLDRESLHQNLHRSSSRCREHCAVRLCSQGSSCGQRLLRQRLTSEGIVE